MVVLLFNFNYHFNFVLIILHLIHLISYQIIKILLELNSNVIIILNKHYYLIIYQ